jgi:hypothetical protein
MTSTHDVSKDRVIIVPPLVEIRTGQFPASTKASTSLISPSIGFKSKKGDPVNPYSWKGSSNLSGKFAIYGVS